MTEDIKTGGRGGLGPPHDQVRRLDALICRLDSLPALSSSVARVLDLSLEAGQAEYVAAVACDLAIACRVLQRARQDRPDAQAQSLPQVVDILGGAGVRSAVLGLKVLEESTAGYGGLPYAEFCRHGLAVACAAEAIASRLPDRVSPALAFLCGLTHDLGKAILALCLPRSYQRVLDSLSPGADSIARLEQAVLGLDHGLAGRRASVHWQLPQPVREAVWLHHQPPLGIAAAGGHADLILIVRLGDILARRQGIGFSGNFDMPGNLAELSAGIGLAAEELPDIAAQLPARVAAAMPSASPGGAGGYRVSLVEAATDLARRHEELSRQARAWQRQADALRRIRSFLSQVSPSATVPALCRQIAGLFVSDSGGDAPGRSGAFAITGDGHAMLVLSAPGGQEICRTVRCGGSPTVPAQSPLPATALRETLAWPEDMNPEEYLVLPLARGQTLIGGVLLPQRQDPSPWQDFGQELVETAAFVLAGALGRARAEDACEQLAAALQRLDQTGEALARAQTLLAIGELAAGAAHEMNNPLTVISGRAQMLAQRAAGAEERASAELIVRKAQEISDIATDLMSFARPAPPRPAVVAAGELLAGARDAFLSSVQPKTQPRSVDIAVQEDCPPLWADAEQMTGVLVELLRNAATAGGQNVKLGMDAGLRPGTNAALIRVVDDGPGMDPGTLAAAFTPFFSRRPAGRGRGMGLARAHRVTQANGGRMWIDSRSGGGTTVFLEVPVARPGPDPA